MTRRMRDLIETLWNVKMNAAGGYYNTYWRFNRDIVECKEKSEAFRFEEECRFNRDIVECKDVVGLINDSASDWI